MDALALALEGMWEGFVAAMAVVGTMATILFIGAAISGKNNG